MSVARASSDFPGFRVPLRRAILAGSLALIVLGIVVLCGWQFHIEALKTVLRNRVGMKANTALSFLASGAALLLGMRTGTRSRRFAQALAAGVLAMGGLTLVEYVFGIDLHIDQLVYTDKVQSFEPGRMAAVSSIGFCLAGVSMLLLCTGSRMRRFSQLPAVLLGGLAFSSIVAYGYGVPLLYGSLKSSNSMAIHTGVAFLVLACCLLLSYPESFILAALSARETGGWLARRFLGIALLAPVLLGYLCLRPAVNFGELRFGMALFAVSLSLLATLALLSLTLFLNQLQRRARAAEHALLQSEKLALVGRLSASIAHEINNPIDAVMNLIYLARQETSEDSVQELLGQADRELQQVASISHHTLSFYKQGSRPELVFASSLFDSMLTLHTSRIRNRKLRLERRERADQAICCFPGEIRQVLVNLIGNAIDATPPEGRLLLRSRNSVDVATGERGVRLTIADDGCGMDRATVQRLFEAFFTTKGAQGNGLGLWVSAEILSRHGSRMRVRSRMGAEAHGTVFSFFLPCERAMERMQA